MSKVLKIFPNGVLVEFDQDQPVALTKTEGKVGLLIKALHETQAADFVIEPPDAVLPELPVARSSQTRRAITQDGLDLIKYFEGLHQLIQTSEGTYVEAYRDPVGIWTIGWGCTEGVYEGMRISVAEAETWLQKELNKFEQAVEKLVKVEINDQQFSALVAFSYNVGAYALSRSTLLKRLHEGDVPGAADEFLRWNKAEGQVLLGLTRRRRAERALFLGQPWREAADRVPAPTLRFIPGKPLMQGDDVRKLQKALRDQGFAIGVDGFFGKQTDLVVKEFQAKMGLTVDGVVGEETRKKLGL